MKQVATILVAIFFTVSGENEYEIVSMSSTYIQSLVNEAQRTKLFLAST